MAFPTDIETLATDWTNASDMENDHPDVHNAIAGLLLRIQNTLGTGVNGSDDDLATRLTAMNDAIDNLGGASFDLSVAVKSTDYDASASDFDGRVLRFNPSAGAGLVLQLPDPTLVTEGKLFQVLVTGAGELSVVPNGVDQSKLVAPRDYRQISLKRGLAVIWKEGTIFAIDGALDHQHIYDNFSGITIGNNLVSGTGHRSDIGHTPGQTFDWFLGALPTGGRLEPTATNSGFLKTASATNGVTLHKHVPVSRQQRVDLRIQILTTDYSTGLFAPTILRSSTVDTGFRFYTNGTDWKLQRVVAGTSTDIDTLPVASGPGGAMPGVNAFYKSRVESEVQANGGLTVRGYADIEDGNGFQLLCEVVDAEGASGASFTTPGYWGIRHANVLISTTVTKQIDSFEAWCW